MTIMPMSFTQKIYWFFIEPIFSFFFPQDEIESEIARRKYIEQMEEKGFHFNRKKDGEDLCRR